MSLKMFKKKEVKMSTVGILAGKGGVGKSFLTVLLALAFKKLQCRSAVFDADLYGPSIPQMMPADTLPTQKGKKIYPALSFSIPTMSFAYIDKPSKATAVRAPIANMLIKTFIENIVWENVDVLLFDFPPGTGDIPMTLTQSVPFDGVIIVTTPQMVSINDARRAMELTKRLGVEVIGVVENMSYYQPCSQSSQIFHPFGQGGGELLAEEFGVPLLAKLPLSDGAGKTINQGRELLFEEALEKHSLESKIMDVARLLQKILNPLKITQNSGCQVDNG